MNSQHKIHITLMVSDGSDGKGRSAWDEADRATHDAMWDAEPRNGVLWSVFKRVEEDGEEFDLLMDCDSLTNALLYVHDELGIDDAYVGPGIYETDGWIVNTVNKHDRRQTFVEYTSDQLLAIPLKSDSKGQIEDRHGENIADVWQRTMNGAPADDEDDAEAEELAKLRAAEIVKRCNAYPEMQSTLSLCLLVLNQIPNRSIRGDRSKTTYQLASRIEKLLAANEA